MDLWLTILEKNFNLRFGSDVHKQCVYRDLVDKAGLTATTGDELSVDYSIVGFIHASWGFNKIY